MDKKALVKSAAYAFGAQGLIFLCSGLMTLAVPKIMGVREYSYWQLFIFYTGYTSYLQFGLNDGVYLKYGGATREDVDKRAISSQFVVSLIMQAAIGTAVLLAAPMVLNDVGRQFVVLAVGVYLVISNTAYYWGYVFQALNETKVYSLSQIIDRVCFVVLLVVFIAMGVSDYRTYVILTICTRAVSLAYSLYMAKDFLVVSRVALREAFPMAFDNMRSGIVLTLANVSSLLIVGTARMLVDMRWGIEAFGLVSMSFSLVNFALAFITQGSMVLFPALRQVESHDRGRLFRRFRDGLGVLLPLALLLFFPMYQLVSAWLPQYGGSLRYLFLLMPVCILDAQTNLTLVTFLKVRNEPGRLLGINFVALMLAGLGMLIAAWAVNSIDLLVICAVFGIGTRYVLGNSYLSRQYEEPNRKMIVSQIALLGCSLVAGLLCEFMAYLAICIASLLIYELINFKELKASLGSLIRM